MMRRYLLALCLLLLSACGTPTRATDALASVGSATTGGRTTLRLATTTSTADTGLLDAILPDFEQRYNADVEVVAVGTGQALKLGENGDVDVVLVHARQREDEFVAKGYGINRQDVMYNDFVVVGPSADPAQISGTTTAKAAFSRIAQAAAPFASRGDDSGTYTKEQSIWASAGITPTADLNWYKSLGQGMGETLLAANEQRAYTLADRGTYLSLQSKLPDLRILVGGATIEQNSDPTLRNPYGVIQINPDKHAGINSALAAQFVAWITAPDVQQRIGAFGKDQFGQSLFYPSAQR